MKLTPAHLASALVDVTSHADTTALRGEVDAALEFFHRQWPGKSVRTFPSLVSRALLRKYRSIDARLVTPHGKTKAATVAEFEKALSASISRTVDLEEQQNQHLIGGAILTVNGPQVNERLDASLRGALHDLRDHLIHPIHP